MSIRFEFDDKLLLLGNLTLPEGVETGQSPDTVVVAATLTAAGRGQEAAEAEAAAAATEA